MDTEEAIESICIRGLNLEKVYGLSFPRHKENCP